MIRNKTMKDGTIAKLVYDADGESVQQLIVQVHDEYVVVRSSEGNEYPVRLSDKVKMTQSVNVGDTAVVKIFHHDWLVFAVIPATTETVDEFDILYRKKIKNELTAEELQRYNELLETEVQEQADDFDNMFGGY